MGKRLGAAATLGVAASLLAVSGCTGPATTAGSATAVNIYLYQRPVGVFSPLAPASGPDMQVMSFFDEGLLVLDPKSNLQPALARGYDVSQDATTFTFHLRPGLKWSDGAPFTSQDVLFTYERMADPKTTSSTAGNYAVIAGVADFKAGKAKNISGLSAPDPNTFVIRTTSPDAGLPAQLGITYIIPKHILGAIPPARLAKDRYFRAPTVGIGPYRFVESKSDQYVRLTANPYYRSPARIQDVYLKPMSSDVATAQLGNGGIDIASFSPTDLSTVQSMAKVAIQHADSAGFVRIAMNQSKPYFADARVRQAFLYAVDRKSIVDKVLLGQASVRNSDFDQKNTPPGINAYTYDPGRAAQLLRQAGWDFSRTVELEWVPGQRDRDAAATIIQNQLGRIGVKVALKQVQGAQIAPSEKDKSFDMLLYGGGNYAADPSSVDAITNCSLRYPKGANISLFCDPALDALMQQGNATSDPATRKAAYDKAVIEENNQADLMWLYNPKGLWGVNRRLHGFQAPGTQEAPFWAPATWSISR